MAVKSFAFTLQDYLRTAAAAARDNKHVLCVHNLSDALRVAADSRERADAYKCYADMFAGVGNTELARAALFRACKEADRGGFYSLDFEKFFPYDEIWEENEFQPIDSDGILAYNDVYNYFLLGEYGKGFDVLTHLPPDPRSMDEVIGVLYDAIESGKNVDINAYAYKILLAAGAYATRSADLVRVLLHGSKTTREVMVEGVHFFASEVEDVRVLARIGREFFNEHEFDCAEICFDKVLEEIEIDEEALYYKAGIGLVEGKQDAEKYWERYKLTYGPFGAPVSVYERAFRAKVVPAYGKLRPYAVEDDVEKVLGRKTRGDDSFAEAAKAALAYGTEERFAAICEKRGLTDETMLACTEEILLSPYVCDLRKERIVNELYEEGYEGRVAICFRNKGVIFDCVKLSMRKNREIWSQVYKKVSAGIVCCKRFVPYRAATLLLRIKDFEKICENDKIEVERADVPFLCTVMAAEYNRTIRKHTNIDWVNEILPPLSPEELRRGIKKFPPEVIRF